MLSKNGADESKVRVLIVDDHPLVRRGLQLLVTGERDLTVCGEAASAAEALALISELQPDVAIVDVNLEDSSGLDLIQQMRAEWPKVKALVFTLDEKHEQSAYRAGAHGFVTKEQGPDKALKALRLLLQGKSCFSSALRDK